MRSASSPRGGGTGTAAFRNHSPATPEHQSAAEQDLGNPISRTELMTRLRNANDDDPALWTTPWRLARDAGVAQSEGKWPPAVFSFFEEVIRSPEIIEVKGSHSFLDVLYQYRELLDDAQKNRLKAALDSQFWISSPLLFQSVYRMKEYLSNSPEEVIKLFQDASDSAIRGQPSQIEWALGLFRTFEPVGTANLVGTQCKATTELHEGLSFTVSLPPDSLDRLLKRTLPPPIRADLYTSRLSREGAVTLVLDRLDETLRLLDAYDDKRRLETLTTLPSALAITQGERTPWSSRIFNALLDDVSLAMEVHGVEPQVHFLSIFKVLEKIKGVTSAQKTQALTWLKQNIGGCTDEATQRAVAKFVVDRYGEAKANEFMGILKNTYRASQGAPMGDSPQTSGIPDIRATAEGAVQDQQLAMWQLGEYHQNYERCANGVASAIAVCLQERADKRAMEQSQPRPQAPQPTNRLRRAANALASAASSASNAAALAAARLAVSVSPSSMRRTESGTPSWSASRQGSVSPGDSVSPAPESVSPRPPRLVRSASVALDPLTLRVPSAEKKGGD